MLVSREELLEDGQPFGRQLQALSLQVLAKI
jgi:hypothetical protein